MERTEMDNIVENMAEYICDHICQKPKEITDVGRCHHFFIDGQPGDVCSTFLYSDLVLQRNERAAE